MARNVRRRQRLIAVAAAALSACAAATPPPARPMAEFLDSLGINTTGPDRGQPMDRTIAMVATAASTGSAAASRA